MASNNLAATAQALVAPGKGILAADESTGTITKRLKSVGVESTEETRRAYRDVLLTAPGLGESISGVILFDETLRQKSSAGLTFVDALTRAGIMPGIKVDAGAKPLANFPGDKVTEGLDGLRDRLAEYVRLGARFTKWRAVIKITEQTPSDFCLAANAHALARYAALSQEAGLVPIVEPEVLMDGPHPLERHFEVTERAIRRVFVELAAHRVALEGMLLKPNMVLSGTECGQQAGIEEVADATVRCLRRVVPPAVPGIVFLSGGQSDVLATQHLEAMNHRGGAPWQLSFSFGRALQAPALNAWAGKREQAPAAQKALLERARANSAARFGKSVG
jgi:fructose-bisphosphate aldolase, class I